MFAKLDLHRLRCAVWITTRSRTSCGIQPEFLRHFRTLVGIAEWVHTSGPKTAFARIPCFQNVPRLTTPNASFSSHAGRMFHIYRGRNMSQSSAAAASTPSESYASVNPETTPTFSGTSVAPSMVLAPTQPAGEVEAVQFVDPASHGAYNLGGRVTMDEEIPQDEAFRRQQQIQDALRRESMRKFLRQFLMAFGFVLTAHAFLFVMAKKQGVFDLERVRDSDGNVVRVLPSSMTQHSTGSNQSQTSKSSTESLHTLSTHKELSAPSVPSTTQPNVVTSSTSNPTSSANLNTKVSSTPSSNTQTWGEYLVSFIPFRSAKPASIPTQPANSDMVSNAPVASAGLHSIVSSPTTTVSGVQPANSTPESVSMTMESSPDPYIIRVREPRFAVTRESMAIIDDDDDADMLNIGYDIKKRSNSSGLTSLRNMPGSATSR